MNLRSIVLGTSFVGGSVLAAGSGIPVEVVKHASTVLGFVYLVGKIIHAVLNWGDVRVKTAVREEIDKRFATLPCINARPVATPIPIRCEEVQG